MIFNGVVVNVDEGFVMLSVGIGVYVVNFGIGEMVIVGLILVIYRLWVLNYN